MDDVDAKGEDTKRPPRVGAADRQQCLDRAEGHLLAAGGLADRIATAMLDASALGLAADAAGGALAVLERSVAYALERVQFGRPIGSFQAVKHRLADLYLLVQASSASVEAAARARPCSRSEQGETAAPDSATSVRASLAYAYATESFAKVAGDGILVHGAIGFTWEHALHRYLKRADLDKHLGGPTAWHRDRFLTEYLARLGSSQVAS
jgi:alkylation response protein AidB-like acyl-CoA dehydrogenase